MKEKSRYWPVGWEDVLVLLRRYFSSELVLLAHAVQTPGVFQLVFTPCCGEGFCFLLAEVVGEFLRYAFGGEKSAVGVEGDDHFLFWVWWRHVCDFITLQ
jgi:hypothetical protein